MGVCIPTHDVAQPHVLGLVYVMVCSLSCDGDLYSLYISFLWDFQLHSIGLHVACATVHDLSFRDVPFGTACLLACVSHHIFKDECAAYVTLCFYDKKMNLTSVVPGVHLNFQFLHSHVSFFDVAEVQPVTGVVNSCELGDFSCCVDACIRMGMVVCDLSSNMY